ncbi:hypothetical protein K4R08_06085 [Staphylococcus epidermidis]|nr:hypothetical protein [Staphylococcus epidermidis]
MKYEHSFKKNLKKFEYPKSYIIAIIMFVLIGIMEFVFYVPFIVEKIFYVISDIDKLSRMWSFIGTILSIIIIYIYILSKIYLLFNINDYTKSVNMIKTYINDKNDDLKTVEAMFIGEQGNVIVETKEGIPKNNNDFLIEKNRYNQYSNIEYYTSSKDYSVIPTMGIFIIPMVLVVVGMIILYINLISGNHYLSFIIPLSLLSALTICEAIYYVKKAKKEKCENGEAITNDLKQFINKNSKDREL